MEVENKPTRNFIGGSFIQLPNGSFSVTLCMDDLVKTYPNYDKKHRRYARIVIAKMREPNQFGTHYMYEDPHEAQLTKSLQELRNLDEDGRPEQTQQLYHSEQPLNNTMIDIDSLPF